MTDEGDTFDEFMDSLPTEPSYYFTLHTVTDSTNAPVLNEHERIMRECIARDPDSAAAHYQLGNVFLLRRDMVSARSEWQRVLEIAADAPNDENQGWALEASNRLSAHPAE